MKKRLKIFILFLFLLVSIYFIILNNIVMHEEVHQQIFYRYGIETRIEMDKWPIPSGKVYGLNQSYGYNNTKCNDDCKTHHALNDVIQYNLVTLSNFIILTLLIFFMWKLFVRDKK